MKILKKIKHILSQKKKSADNNSPQKSTKENLQNPMTEELHLITTRIMAWIDSHGWQYRHKTLESDKDIHRLVLGFAEQDGHWLCVFRINERSQIVSILGLLEKDVPSDHHQAMMMAVAKTNLEIQYGSIEFDPIQGELGAKLAFDTEFSQLSDRALLSYLQVMAGLVELTKELFDKVLCADDDKEVQMDDDKKRFFLPTNTYQ